MPRTLRASHGGICYHVLNRGNARGVVFHNGNDYRAFEDLIGEACARLPMRVLGYSLMPNHFHLVLWPHEDGDMSRWMQWLLTSHVRRHHRAYDTSGHVWQGRFKAFPIDSESYLLTVLRYVERNALRARLVRSAEAWRWSSLHWRASGNKLPFLSDPPVILGGLDKWIEWVNEPQTDKELEALRRSVNRGTPYGRENWVKKTARKLGLESSLNPRGRPWHKERARGRK